MSKAADNLETPSEIALKTRSFMLQLGISEEGEHYRIWNYDLKLHHRSGTYYSTRLGAETFNIHYKEIMIEHGTIIIDTMYSYKEQKFGRLQPGQTPMGKLFRRRYVADIASVDSIEEIQYVTAPIDRIRTISPEQFQEILSEREFISDED